MKTSLEGAEVYADEHEEIFSHFSQFCERI
jgi:hypothetical protein